MEQVIGNKWSTFLSLIMADYNEGYIVQLPFSFPVDHENVCSDAMDALGLKRYCCRRMLMTHVDLVEKLLVSNNPFVHTALIWWLITELQCDGQTRGTMTFYTYFLQT